MYSMQPTSASTAALLVIHSYEAVGLTSNFNSKFMHVYIDYMICRNSLASGGFALIPPFLESVPLAGQQVLCPTPPETYIL